MTKEDWVPDKKNKFHDKKDQSHNRLFAWPKNKSHNKK